MNSEHGPGCLTFVLVVPTFIQGPQSAYLTEVEWDLNCFTLSGSGKVYLIKWPSQELLGNNLVPSTTTSCTSDVRCFFSLFRKNRSKHIYLITFTKQTTCWAKQAVRISKHMNKSIYASLHALRVKLVFIAEPRWSKDEVQREELVACEVSQSPGSNSVLHVFESAE